LQYLNNIEYDFIGQLDADITLGNNFYESLLHKISADTRLGVVGGQVYERIAECFEPVIEHQFNVHGTNQLFRRTCFEDIGGYQPIQTGGEDTVAVITARMMGWKTRTYSNLKVYHHRRMGTANASILRARLKEGVRDYMIGYHYLFHTLKCLKRVSEKPFLLGSIFRFIGFIIGQLCFTNKRSVSKEFVEFLQSEQMKRIYMS
jgi:biofilm PGA synthesis N-glycosyltransferase PgaC